MVPRRKTFVVLFACTLLLAVATPVQASAPPDVYCEEALGGTWVGEDGWTGTCIIPDDNSLSDEYCDDGYDAYLHYDGGIFDVEVDCVPVGANPGGGEEYDHNSTQGGDAPIGLCTIAGGPWRCAIFPPETCGQNCYLDPHLPAAADQALPGGVIATMYVHIVDENGNPGTGSYTVCFENPDGETLTIFRFLGGVWVAVAVGSGNPICTVQSGDGAYYLGS